MILLNLLLKSPSKGGLTEKSGKGKIEKRGREFARHLEREVKKGVKKEELKPPAALPLQFRVPELVQKNLKKTEVKPRVKTPENIGKAKIKTAKATGEKEAGSSILKREVKSALKEETTLKKVLPEEKREEKSSTLPAEKRKAVSKFPLPSKEVAKEGKPSKTAPLAKGKGAETFHSSGKSKGADGKALLKGEVARPTLKEPLKRREFFSSVKKGEGALRAVALSFGKREKASILPPDEKGREAALLKEEKVESKESRPLKTVVSGEKGCLSFKGKKVKTFRPLNGQGGKSEAVELNLTGVKEGGNFSFSHRELQIKEVKETTPDFPKHSPFKPFEGSFFQTSAGNHFHSSLNSPLSHPQEAKPPAPQPSNSFYSFFVKSGGVALRMAVRNRTINLNLQLPQGFVVDGELLNEIRAVIKSAGFNPGKLYLKVKGRTAYSKEAKGEIRV